MTKLNKTECGKVIDSIELLLDSVELDRTNISNTNRVSDRFWRLASFLNKGEYMGVDIIFYGDLKYEVKLFESKKGMVEPSDYNWIFERCGKINETSKENIRDLLDKKNNVYVLSLNKGIINADLSYDEYGMKAKNLLNMLSQDLSIIRIIAGNNEEGILYGNIYFALHNKMSLRLKGAMSLAFPDSEVKELSMITDEIKIFNRDYLKRSMSKILLNLMDYSYQKEELKRLDELEEEDLFEDPFEDVTSIEDMNLSIRTFNCLKRHGINTVKDLKKLSVEDLKQIRNLGKKGVEEVRRKLSEINLDEEDLIEDTSIKPIVNYKDKLNELIGLDEVKEQIKRITAFTKLRQSMDESVRDKIAVTLNMEFTGNPGTAKTTVARIVAGCFYEIGLLKSPEIVEIGRSDLVAKYEGQTAVKVKEIFDKAKGKLIFIDEAYSLIECYEGAFGDEAINTIVQEMENNRKDTIVVFAGYPDKMEEFFSRNPGLRSRVPFHIEFKDYSPEEMVSICELESKRRGFTINKKAKDKILTIVKSLESRSDLGNGRFCRNLIDNALINFATRVYGEDKNCTITKNEFTESDFNVPEGFISDNKIPVFGFQI